MEETANIIFVTDNEVHIFYAKMDGNLTRTGEDIRRRLVYSIGINALTDKSVYDTFVNDLNTYDSFYKDEGTDDLDENYKNKLQSGVDFIYVIKDNELFFITKHNLISKAARVAFQGSSRLVTYNDLINFVVSGEIHSYNKLYLDEVILNDY